MSSLSFALRSYRFRIDRRISTADDLRRKDLDAYLPVGLQLSDTLALFSMPGSYCTMLLFEVFKLRSFFIDFALDFLLVFGEILDHGSQLGITFCIYHVGNIQFSDGVCTSNQMFGTNLS